MNRYGRRYTRGGPVFDKISGEIGSLQLFTVLLTYCHLLLSTVLLTYIQVRLSFRLFTVLSHKSSNPMTLNPMLLNN